jgi:predicted Ser/Thr protein kinase
MGLDPTTIGRYVVLGTLGQGAMGTVYLGEDPSLKRGVALKVVNAGQPQGRELALRRFLREAEISAKLNHPNVITVFDVGEEEGVGPFLAMEFVDGETLEQMIRRGPLDPQRVVEILLQAASALDAAHALGIVHRDVKPANFMVAKDGRVKLMDFGIAKEEDQAGTTEALLCTPGYAAPELLDGAKANAVSDRWAFAISAYECLQGKPPFEGDNISVVLYNVAHGAPVFPEDIASELAAVFRKALAKHPGERHHDLQSFMADLVTVLPLEDAPRRRFLKHFANVPEARPEPVQAMPVKAKDPRRLRAAAWGAAALAAAGLALLGWWQGFLFPRYLRVESVPEGAYVFLEGNPVARTPVKDLAVPRRTREIVLELDGYYPFSHRLGTEEAAIKLRMSPRFLVVDLDSQPSGAQVRVNDVPVGTTPFRGLRIPNVPAGTPVFVIKEGAGSWMAMVNEKNPPPPRVVLTTTKGGG